MPVIGSINLQERRIYLASGVRQYHPVDNIYRELRELRRTNENLRGFDMPVVASGNVAKGGGRFTPRLATFRFGWRIVPEDISHILIINGEQITDDGQSGAAVIDFEPLSPTSKIIVQYEPPSSEIIVKSGAGRFII